MWTARVRALAKRLHLVRPLQLEADFRADPVVRLAAELLDPLHDVPIPPPSTAELLAVARQRLAMAALLSDKPRSLFTELVEHYRRQALAHAHDPATGRCQLCHQPRCEDWLFAYQQLIKAGALSDLVPLHDTPGGYVRSRL
jgi:hypothetical protein